jgi:hypothetical protein
MGNRSNLGDTEIDADRRQPDRPDPAVRAARSAARASWAQVAVACVALIVGLLVGGGGGYLAGHTTSRTHTVTRTVTSSTTTQGGGVGGVACAPNPGAPGPRNDTTGTAAGPVTANIAVPATILATNEAHYLALCLKRPAEVTLSLNCIRGSCGSVFGEFPADADTPSAFQPGANTTCDLSAAGRYNIQIHATAVPVTYQLLVQTKDPGAVVSSLPADVPAPDPNTAC